MVKPKAEGATYKIQTNFHRTLDQESNSFHKYNPIRIFVLYIFILQLAILVNLG